MKSCKRLIKASTVIILDTINILERKKERKKDICYCCQSVRSCKKRVVEEFGLRNTDLDYNIKTDNNKEM